MARPKNKNTPEMRARVGERIKLATQTAQLSMKEMAERIGIPPAIIYQYVRGVTSIPPETLERIAAEARVPIEFFDPDRDTRAALALPAEAPQGEPAAPDSEPGTRARIQADMRHLHALAQAYRTPQRNRASYLSTMEQMLALARTLDDRRQEGWILWQIGRAKLDDSNPEAARQTLLAARQLFLDEDLEEYAFHTTQDLVMALSEMGEFEAARAYMEDILPKASRSLRWRILITIGGLRYRQHDYEDALRYFSRAAEQLEEVDPEERDRQGMPDLMAGLADVVRATGHYEEAMMLWSRCLQQAFQDRDTETFLESLMEVAQCCQLMGQISEARKNLEMAVVVASFLFEDNASLGVARALLASALVAMGALDEAKDHARESLKIAHQVRGARPTILATLALTETCLAAGQWRDALDYAQDALDEAGRTGRTREVAQAREMRARACLQQFEAARAAGEEAQAQALGQAYTEAMTALEVAQKAQSVRDEIAAHVTLARCFYYQGDAEAAERAARAALDLTREGAVQLNRLLGKDVAELPALLRAPHLDVQGLFAGRRLNLPGLEWQAHYLEGSALAKRLGPGGAFSAMRDAASAVSKILAGMTAKEAASFQKRHPEVAAVFSDLKRYALTDSDRREAAALLAAAPWAVQAVERPAIGPGGLTT